MSDIIDFGSFQIRFLKTRHETNDAVDVFELILSPDGKMPVPHYHKDWEETVYGVRGKLMYTIDGTPHEIRAGDCVFVPRGVVHGFSNESGETAVCLCVLTPGKLGPEYFQELAAEIGGDAPDPEKMRSIMERYGLIPG